MKESDRGRWDRKYAAGEGPAHFQPNRLLTENRNLLTGGRALDVACGFGGNALYLASLGYQVDAIDVSAVALARARQEARRRGLQVNLLQADLARWWVPTSHYDLIVVFFYLNRELMPLLGAALRPRGLLFQANRNKRFLEIRPGFSPGYLLEPGELQRLASIAGLEILYYADPPPGRLHNSQIIARRPLQAAMIKYSG
jgi:SAM-dependent methyltransferase